MKTEIKKESKIGFLSFIASTKGCKFSDEPNVWYNPSNTAKEMVNDQLKGKLVEIILIPGQKNRFESICCIEAKDDIGEVPVETVCDTMIDEDCNGDITPFQTVAEIIGVDETLSDAELDSQLENHIGGSDKKVKDAEEKEVELNEIQIDEDAILDKKEDTCEYTLEVYDTMSKTKLKTDTRGPYKLTYASWAEAWGAIKRLHPTAKYHVHENRAGMPYFIDDTGAFVKVTVTILGLPHTCHLPVMDYNKNPMKKESYVIRKKEKDIHVAGIDALQINNNIQRALVKAIALHGLGLYVFKGEEDI